ncbi:MAG: ribonuclease III [Deltaproteobacteria bacterium HGW-Deltaproteobacteria-4]|nr:MAG: ribonuclease III [Deltaproteobacteria bacterium HGW-Deltaproteobacteria-4]
MIAENREKLQTLIGYHFSDTARLDEALTHRSYANEQRTRCADNERLEFLGDAILGLVIAETLFIGDIQRPEGELSRLRSELVNAGTLAQLARQINLGAALKLGRGEVKAGGSDKENILADAFEALLGAIYLEGGIAAVRPVILRLFTQVMIEKTLQQGNSDFKSQLQEYLQSLQQTPPEYVLIETEGPEHERTFVVEARTPGQVLGVGQGRSKKEAEQAAAGAALKMLQR